MAVRPIPARRAASSQRVGRGPEEIEERGGFEALSHRRRKAHRRVVVPREAEGEVRGLQGLKTFLGCEIHRDAQGFEHVRRARRGRDAAVAVLHDGEPGARGRQRDGGRDVEGAGAVAARPHDVARRAVRGDGSAARRIERAAPAISGGVAPRMMRAVKRDASFSGGSVPAKSSSKSDSISAAVSGAPR